MNGISRRAFLAASSAFAGRGASSRGAFAQAPKESRAPAGAGRCAARCRRSPSACPRTRWSSRRSSASASRAATGTMPLVGGGSLSMLVRYQGYEPLVRFNAGLVRASRPTSPRATRSTPRPPSTRSRLRKGHKWSDGQPFTTADVQFWYDAYFTDAETNLGGNSWWSAGGEPAKLEVIDEQTFKVDVRHAERLLPAAARLGRSRTRSSRTPQALPRAVPHQATIPRPTSSPRRRALESWIALFQQRARLSRRQHLLPEHQAARRSTPGSSTVEGASAPGAEHRARRSRCATPTTTRSIPRARSSPTSTASSTRWSPIPRCCC